MQIFSQKMSICAHAWLEITCTPQFTLLYLYMYVYMHSHTMYIEPVVSKGRIYMYMYIHSSIFNYDIIPKNVWSQVSGELSQVHVRMQQQ